MIQYLSQFTANDLVVIHCAAMLIAISTILSISLVAWLAMYAYEILIVTWYETKGRRKKAASKLNTINGIYTINS
jgi:antibiotic biosynthesis monooxygenase (ABM) superfamily enzyme